MRQSDLEPENLFVVLFLGLMLHMISMGSSIRCYSRWEQVVL